MLFGNDRLDRFDSELFAGPPALLSVENAEGIVLKPDKDRFQLAVALYAVDGIFDAFGSENGSKIGADPAELYLSRALVHRFSLVPVEPDSPKATIFQRMARSKKIAS